ncbi:hypothetical protein CXB51_014570 [Gossypium anomalum]|uniref:Uncharacterized protein n=1 Tax=Gossypium anomalum TaxID=47600 RepID=A0A8J5Z4K2_9ROSI|nr:hypothetical protein CXB51_014570 [Gossypium anomalum]
MYSSTNRKSTAQKKGFVLPLWVKGSRLQREYSKEKREKILWVCELQRDKLGFVFWSIIVGFTKGCDFFQWVEDNYNRMDSTVEEQGCKIDEIILQNKMLLIENRRLRLENDEHNIDKMQRMRLNVTRLEEKITL